jgi:hypothetical protein
MLSPYEVEMLIWVVVYGNDDHERASAINNLSIAFLKSNDPLVAAAIAGFIRDEQVKSGLRVFAYICLLDVSPCQNYPDLKTFRFPRDVDWKFVDSYRPIRRPTAGDDNPYQSPGGVY